MVLATSLAVIEMNSIIYRITGLMFLTVAFTVFLLIYLANVQMTEQFQEYLVVQQMEMSHHGKLMGPLEETFLASVHNSLIWVGLAILGGGLAASYFLARSITVPLRKVSKAAEEIARGNYEQKVKVETKDEVGNLALLFNKMSEALATNTNLRKQLLANVAHELRTPLAIIQGHLEGMVDGVIAPSKEQLQSLHEEAVKLNRLIAELRDLSLAEVRQLALEKQPVDINQLLLHSVSMLKPAAESRGIQIRCELTEDLPMIMADAHRLSQVFYNLLINGLRYSSEGSQIKVKTFLSEEADKSWICIWIEDQGIGISQEDLPYLFEHFYRGDKSRDRKSGGSGLGLAIVKQLLEIHGGKVSVESTVGEGSCFKVMLPIYAAE